MDWQIGNRYAETLMINLATRVMSNNNDKDCTPILAKHGISSQSSKFVVICDKVNGMWMPRIPTPQVTVPYPHLDVIRFLIGSAETNGEVIGEVHILTLFTEYRRDDSIFRSHPQYRSEGPWYDWVMLRWEKEEGDVRPYNQSTYDSCVHYGDSVDNTHDYIYAPGEIYCFCENTDKEVMVVVWSCGSYYSKSSVFSTKWKRGYLDRANTIPLYELVNTSAIVRPCLMVPESADRTVYHEVWDMDRWSDQF